MKTTKKKTKSKAAPKSERKPVNEGRAFGYALAAQHQELREAARNIVREAIEANDGNRTHAAEALGVNPGTLFAWLEKWPELGR